MAEEQRDAAAHKTTRNAITTAPNQHEMGITKLGNPVGDQSAPQIGLTTFAVELPREKSWKEPPAGATSLIVADNHHENDKEWTTVQHRANPSQSRNKKGTNTIKEGSNKRIGNHTRNDKAEIKPDTKKRFQARQHTQPQLLTEGDDETHMTIAEKIKLRGATAVEKAVEVVTPVTIEFLVPKNTKVFHIRSEVTKLFTKIKETDNELKISVLNKNTKWNVNEIPSGKEFESLFNAQYKTSARGAGRAKIKCNLHTRSKFATIKYENAIFSYLEMNKIYVNYDAFNTLNTSSPGFLINLHPTLTRKDNLQTSLAEDMAKVPINRQNSVIKHWLDDNNAITTEAELPIPKFTLFTATRKFGYGENKVEAAVIVIESADKDAQYLKTILNFGYENKYLVHGIFVPTGIHLTTNPAVYKGLLRQQNTFVNSLLVLAIEGLSEEATMQDIEIDGKVTNIGEYIMAHAGIVGLERTGRTSEIGKWFLLYTANAKDTVDTIIDDKLPIIFNSQIDKAHNIEGYVAPRRTNARLTTTTSYADTLKNMIITTEKTTKDAKQDTLPINVKKRRPVALSMEEYPILKTTKKQNTSVNTNTVNTPSTESASISTVTNDHIQSLENKIEAMATQGKTLQEEFDQLKQTIQQQVAETVEVQFNTSIKTKLDALATDMMTFFQTQMITKMEEMMQHLFTTMTTNTAMPAMQHTMNTTQAHTMPMMQFQNNTSQTQIATPLKPQNIQKPPGPITPMTQTQQYGRLTNLSLKRQTASQEEFLTQQDSVEHDMDLDADGHNK